QVVGHADYGAAPRGDRHTKGSELALELVDGPLDVYVDDPVDVVGAPRTRQPDARHDGVHHGAQVPGRWCTAGDRVAGGVDRTAGVVPEHDDQRQVEDGDRVLDAAQYLRADGVPRGAYHEEVPE